MPIKDKTTNKPFLIIIPIDTIIKKNSKLIAKPIEVLNLRLGKVDKKFCKTPFPRQISLEKKS